MLLKMHSIFYKAGEMLPISFDITSHVFDQTLQYFGRNVSVTTTAAN